ncbi:unnamed protein product, partial [Hapterophycus canaliculatus]
MPSSRKRVELGEELGIAAKNGRLSAVKKLLGQGAYMEIPTEVMGMMMTPLNAAAFTNNESIVNELIKAGADVNGRHNTGHTPLHCCAMEGQEEMMRKLLSAGANPTLASVEGQTALHTAAQWGNPREVKTLAAAGAKVDARCTKGYTPLRLAAWKGTAESVKACLEVGADVGVKDDMGNSILSVAFQNNDDGIYQLLLDAGADPDVADPDGDFPPLLCALSARKPKVAEQLIAAGANPNLVASNGMTPVVLATKMGLSYCLAVLLRSGGSPHPVVDGALTPCQVAIIDRRPKCLSLLIAAGANPLRELDYPSAFLAAERRELCSMKHRPDTPGARVLRVLLQAEGYAAGSWQWSCADKATSAFGNQGEHERRPKTEQEGLTTSTASTRWIAHRRGLFLPTVIRSV